MGAKDHQRRTWRLAGKNKLSANLASSLQSLLIIITRAHMILHLGHVVIVVHIRHILNQVVVIFILNDNTKIEMNLIFPLKAMGSTSP